MTKKEDEHSEFSPSRPVDKIIHDSEFQDSHMNNQSINRPKLDKRDPSAKIPSISAKISTSSKGFFSFEVSSEMAECDDVIRAVIRASEELKKYCDIQNSGLY